MQGGLTKKHNNNKAMYGNWEKFYRTCFTFQATDACVEVP